MIHDKNSAQALAQREVDKQAAAAGGDFVLITDEIISIERGWIFFYESREYMETGKFSSRLLGNGPIFVSRSGVIVHLPTAEPWEVSILNIRDA